MTKRNRRSAVATAAAFAVLIASGCEQDLTEINENPNAPESVPVQNLLLGGIWDVSANSGNRGVFGTWTQLYHAENWVQHVAQTGQGDDEDRYTPRGGIPENIWTEMYAALQDLAAAKELVAGGVDDNAWAVAEIMSVYGFMILTDYYGDIPYTEALQLNADPPITQPAYDAQSSIYPDLISRLANAASVINPGAVVTFGAFDPVYAGDMDGWRAFANSLRLRLAMRMSNSNATVAESEFVAAWGSTLISNVGETADVDWDGTFPAANPVYEGLVLSGRTLDFRMSASLIDRLIAFNDPRLPIYAQPAESDGLFRGATNGLVNDVVNDVSRLGTYFLASDTPSVLMSYAEVLFLGAEAAALGWIADDAETLYGEAITASMGELGIDSGDIAAYLAQNEVGYTTGTYQGLDAIRVQKWINLYVAGPEAFAEMRRIGWDWTTDAGTTGQNLSPAVNSTLPAGEFPARLYYPPNESLFNPDNIPTTGGLTDPVWWAQ